MLENDEICYNCDDLLPVCEELNIPLVFGTAQSLQHPAEALSVAQLADYHHDWIYPSKQPPSELIPRILKLWERKGIKPKFHLSEPRKGAETIMVRTWSRPETLGRAADLVVARQEKRAHADRCQRLPEVLPDDMGVFCDSLVACQRFRR